MDFLGLNNAKMYSRMVSLFTPCSFAFFVMAVLASFDFKSTPGPPEDEDAAVGRRAKDVVEVALDWQRQAAKLVCGAHAHAQA